LSATVDETIPAADAAKPPIGQGHNWIQVCARDGPNREDNGDKCSCCRCGILKELQAGVLRAEPLSGDP